MLVTNSHYYNIEDKKIKRKVEIKDLMAFTVSMVCNDFILHVHNEYDYQLISEHNDLILEVLSYVYSSVTQDSLKVYSVPSNSKDMEKYVTTKK